MTEDGEADAITDSNEHDFEQGWGEEKDRGSLACWVMGLQETDMCWQLEQHICAMWEFLF